MCGSCRTNAAVLRQTTQRTVLPAVPRIIAIGDLHGDLEKARRAFRLGGLIDENDRWVGGTTTAVQVQRGMLHGGCGRASADVPAGHLRVTAGQKAHAR